MWLHLNHSCGGILLDAFCAGEDACDFTWAAHEQFALFAATFEDKRKENFDKGQAELERRRALLREQMQAEENARLEKERREAEKRERIRSVRESGHQGDQIIWEDWITRNKESLRIRLVREWVHRE